MANVKTCKHLVIFAFVAGCASIPQTLQPITDEETRNAIALCHGGFGADFEAALQTKWAERNGQVVLAGELAQIQQGQNPFVVSNLSGVDAVQMYNTYVECISRSQQPSSDEYADRQTDDLASEAMEMHCDDGLFVIEQGGYNRELRYSCVIRNNSNETRTCRLMSTCVVKGRRTDRVLGRHESEVLSFSILPGSVDDESGRVRCLTTDPETMFIDVERTLLCSN